MESIERTGMHPIERENAFLLSFVARFEGRGFSRAARETEQKMISTEEAARLETPEAYRLDSMVGNGRGDQYHHVDYLGRKTMSVDDYLAYFAGRRRSLDGAPVVERQGKPESVVPVSREGSHLVGPRAGTGKKATTLRRVTAEAVSTVKVWKTTGNRVESDRGRRNRLPVSMIASFFVITLCLMMIISASVMVAGAQYDVSELKSEVSDLKAQAEVLEDKLESRIDYLEIYRAATEEYGMIDTAYVSSAYLANDTGNTVEVFEAEETVRFGLGTLLSAIGIDIGSR